MVNSPQDDAGKSTLFEVQEKLVVVHTLIVVSTTILMCAIIRYVYRLGAPTSAIQLQSEETLTYLNKGDLSNLLVNTAHTGHN